MSVTSALAALVQIAAVGAAHLGPRRVHGALLAVREPRAHEVDLSARLMRFNPVLAHVRLQTAQVVGAERQEARAALAAAPAIARVHVGDLGLTAKDGMCGSRDVGARHPPPLSRCNRDSIPA